MGVCLGNLLWYEREGDEFLDRIVAGDESWCSHYCPETKRMSQQWQHPSSPRPKKSRAIPSAGKVMLTSFFDRRGPLLIAWLPKGITVNADRYGETLKGLRSAIKTKRPGMLSCGVILLHDNARPHSARTTLEKLQQFRWEVLPYPPYSPDVSHCDCHVFGPMKKAHKGQRFATDADVQEAITSWLHRQPQDFYSRGIDGPVKLWAACLSNHGAYAE
jgi:histone-lysine N-methyltransferase SETMAR